jgi:hypothetical protein
MHRFSIALLLALTISSPAQAQLWDYVVTSEFGNMYYIDPLSIQRKDSIVSYTQLINYSKNKEINKKDLRSIVQYKTNDCEANRFRISGFIAYEKENAKGSIMIVEFAKDDKWLTIYPKKVAEIIHEEVCNYKYE